MRNRTFVVTAAAAAVVALSAFTASAETVGGNTVAFDGYKYGGNLPVGFDKNVDAVRVLIKVANAMGQVRDNLYFPASYLVIGDSTTGMRISANGTWDGQKVHVVLDWDFRVPGVRLDVSPDGKAHTITVASGTSAWDESKQGVYSGPAKASAAERMVLAYLMPNAVAIAGRDSADVIKLSKDGARDVLTIPVPKLGAGVNLVAKMDTEGHPIHTEIAMGGKVYSADLDEFIADRMDLAVIAAHHVVYKVDGKTVGDLELDWHQTNPYALFIVPKEVAAK